MFDRLERSSNNQKTFYSKHRIGRNQCSSTLESLRHFKRFAWEAVRKRIIARIEGDLAWIIGIRRIACQTCRSTDILGELTQDIARRRVLAYNELGLHWEDVAWRAHNLGTRNLSGALPNNLCKMAC